MTGRSGRAWRTLILLLVLVFGTTACGSDELVVSAAASLTDAFSEIESAFEFSNPDVDVVLNFGGSSTLREQILEGAPVDVFASANSSNMDQLVAAGLVDGQPEVFARNSLQIAVPVDNPAGITGLEDFAREELLIGLCAETVPCGEFARTVLERATVAPALDTIEPDVRALLTKIAAGELDAGITYVTDVASAGGAVDGIEIPQSLNVVAAYPIAVVMDASHPAAAAAFVEFVLSVEGRAILDSYGFSSP
ncbi:MAG TPA: molybdate ABC transporter substrate-binding protein [Acidimicrobiia bacterium]|nr:molybdate ABC transporter substrate-binding protein [Acidimicrobiia bacterium]